MEETNFKEVEAVTQSPTPKQVEQVQETIIDAEYEDVKTLDFYEAIKVVHSGGKARRLDWMDSNYYITLDQNTLKLHKIDDKMYSWIISKEDLDGTDYVKV